jgi:Right handed beta helix region
MLRIHFKKLSSAIGSGHFFEDEAFVAVESPNANRKLIAMRNWILLFLLLPVAALGQSKYYLSAMGDDNNNGTSASTPWLSIAKLNTATYQPGDTIFFNSGDTFRGNILVQQSGSPAGRIVFTSYGSGARPIISGTTLVTNWVQHGDTFAAQVALSVRNFFVNGAQQVMARFPNEHQYLWLDSARTTYLLDNDLTSIPNEKISGSRVCIHTAQWCWEKSLVSGFLLDTIKFQTPVTLNSLDGYGYFLYDNIAHLDTAGEWKYVPGSQRLWYMPPTGQSPANMTCEASVYNFGVQLDNDMCYITIENLDFEKQGSHGVFFPNGGSRYNVVNNCLFNGQLNHGVQDQGKFNEVAHSTFRGIGGIGIFVNSTGGNSLIHHNRLRQIGMQPNYGIGAQINLTAIMIAGGDSSTVHHNDIDSVGYCGISADGGSHLIERNLVRHAMLWNNDGAGLKSWGSISHDIIWRNNFVGESDGTLEGTLNGDFITPGLYFDFLVNHCTVQENTIYNHRERGIFQNSGNTDNHILGNVVYGSAYGLDLNGSPAQNVPQTGFEIKRNTFFALDDQAFLVRQIDYTNTFNTGVIDSNYYFQPYDANRYAIRIVNMVATPYSFSAWQATGFDAHTQRSFVSWSASQNDSRLFMNQTDDTMTVNLLDSLYLDLDSNLICGDLQLLPYTSQVLINTMTVCNPNAFHDPAFSPVQAFPNPTSGEFVVRAGTIWLGAKYRLLNALGQPLASGKVVGTEQRLSLADLPSGMYLLEFTGHSRFMLRVIKQ